MNNWLGFPLTDRSHTAFDLAVLANLNNIVAGFSHEGSRELKWTDNLIYRWLAVYSHAISDHFILMPLLVSSFSARCFSRILLFLLLLVPVWEVFYAFVILIQLHVSCQNLTGMEEKRGREGLWLSMLGRWFCVFTLFSWSIGNVLHIQLYLTCFISPSLNSTRANLISTK